MANTLRLFPSVLCYARLCTELPLLLFPGNAGAKRVPSSSSSSSSSSEYESDSRTCSNVGRSNRSGSRWVLTHPGALIQIPLHALPVLVDFLFHTNHAYFRCCLFANSDTLPFSDSPYPYPVRTLIPFPPLFSPPYIPFSYSEQYEIADYTSSRTTSEYSESSTNYAGMLAA